MAEALVGVEAGSATSRAREEARAPWVEAILALAAFAALCIAVLIAAPHGAEPDDGAYHASIVGITQGHWLTLSASQAESVARKLGDNPSAPPNQWTELADGRYISEKDPGYPFLAAPFQALGIIRWAPLFYGALACLSLFAGARRWLGSFGGFAAVGLYCSSGAALAFAWRDYMPTFTDASLVAVGSGLLLWALISSEASARRRAWVGLAAFIALDLATFARYTNVTALACAVITVIVAWRVHAVGLLGRTLLCWLGSVGVFAIGLAVFNDLVYGGPLTSGYAPGEVSFSLSAIGSNLRLVPRHLLQAMPVMLLAAVAMIWIIGQALVVRHTGDGSSTPGAHRDLFVGLAVGASWAALWGLYSTYTWTTDPTNFAVQDVRFYLPGVGGIALLGAWLITRLPSRAWHRALPAAATVSCLFVLGVWAFHAMYSAFDVPLN
jgi:hypothetical protein